MGAAALSLASCAKDDEAAADRAYLDSQVSFAVPISPVSHDNRATYLYDTDRIGGREVKLVMAHSEAGTLKAQTVFLAQSPAQVLRGVLADDAADGVVFDPVDGRRPRVIMKDKLAALLSQVRSAPDLPFAIQVAK